jgi:hypothetical protein
MRSFIELARYAAVHPTFGAPQPESGGYFKVDRLHIIASWDLGWDHVSVSLNDRCPTWDEMEKVKRLFFRDHETAFQLHVPTQEHINIHPYCLHLWRPHGVAIPRPPQAMVA